MKKKYKKFTIALQDKVIKKYMDKRFIPIDINCANEGEAVAIAAGVWLGTKQRADVYMSADGLCNAMNFLTSWIIPDGIQMNIYVSTGREEPPHKVMTEILPSMLELLNYDTNKLYIETVWKEPESLMNK